MRRVKAPASPTRCYRQLAAQIQLVLRSGCTMDASQCILQRNQIQTPNFERLNSPGVRRVKRRWLRTRLMRQESLWRRLSWWVSKATFFRLSFSFANHA